MNGWLLAVFEVRVLRDADGAVLWGVLAVVCGKVGGWSDPAGFATGGTSDLWVEVSCLSGLVVEVRDHMILFAVGVGRWDM